MAIAITTPDEHELARQAEMLDSLAERKRAEARDLSQQAIELRLEIARQQREPIQIHQPRVAPERDARLLAKIPEILEQVGPCKSPIVAEHLNISQPRALQGLRALEAAGVVKRSGVRRGTIWGLAEDEDLSGHKPMASARTLVLDAARKLDTFCIEDIDAELQMLTTEGIRRQLRALVADGKLSAERDGNRKIYAFERPDCAPVNRPRHDLPEAKVVEFARKTPLQRRGYAVQGTGKRNKPTDKDVRELFEQITQAGGELIRLDNGHWQVKLRDQVIGSLPGSPSDWRSIRNTRAGLRRAGLAI